jgi:hypothetical protein
MNQQILAFSGRKQSGKNTAINFMVGWHMHAIGLVRGSFHVDEKGQLYITDINGDTDFEGIFDILRGTPSMEIFLADNLDAYVKVYNFADLLKQEVCMKILGLSHEQCYGTDEQKNQPTHLMWQKMPDIPYDGSVPSKTGPMTAREVMQYVGSNIFRKMSNNVWVDATIKKIKEEGSALALIADCRFPNEVEGIQKAGGKVVRLTRAPFKEDTHISETALDNYTSFDAVLENSQMSIKEQCDAIYQLITSWNMSPIELGI